MTDSNGTWKAIPGFSSYEASDRGQVRSIDRTLSDGRAVRGVLLQTRRSNRGYLIVNLTDDGGRKQTRSVHSLVLRAFTGPCPQGHASRHLNDDQLDNRLVNLAYGTQSENELDKFRNGRPKPVPPPQPPRLCIRCSEPVTTGGRRCHACVEEIGVELAKLLQAGVRLKAATEKVGYPVTVDGLDGAHELARRYGGYGVQVGVPMPADLVSPAVTVTLRDRLRRRFGKRGGDGA